MPHEKINGLETYFTIEGHGEPVVFVHGLSLDSSIWDDQIEFLSREFETIRYDLRGHGGSDAPSTGYSYDDYAADLREFIRTVAKPPVHLVGMSMGGAIAIHFALDNASYVRTLTLMGTHVVGYTDFTGWPNLNRIARTEGLDAAKDVWKNFRLFASAKEDSIRYNRLAAMIDRFSGAPWLDPHSRYEERDDTELIGSLNVPTLLLAGTGDGDFRPISELLESRLPDAKMELFNCGHLLSYELPDETNEAIISFLRSAR